MIASPDQIAEAIRLELRRQADASPCGDLYVTDGQPGDTGATVDGAVNLVELAIAVMAQARVGYAAIVQGPNTPQGREIRADREPAAEIHGKQG